MKFEKRSFVMNNLFCYTKKLKKEYWWKGFSEIERSRFEDAIYPMGPMFFLAKEELNESNYLNFDFYLPVSMEVEVTKKKLFKKTSFVENITIKEAIFFRQATGEDYFYDKLREARKFADKEKILIEDYFICVYNNFFGESIFDIYLPIREEDDR